MDTEKLKKQNIILALICIAILVILVLLLNHQYQNLKDIKADIAKGEEKIVLYEKRLAQLLVIKEQVPNLKAQLDVFEQLFPKQLSEQDIIGIVQNSLLGTNGKGLEIRFGDAVKVKNYFEFPFQVVFEGDFYGLLSFLQNLKYQPSFVNLHDISIQKGWGKETAIRADLKIAAYYTK